MQVILNFINVGYAAARSHSDLRGRALHFRPRMEAAIRQIVPIGGAESLLFDRMVVDFWRVEVQSGAGGEYVSPDPRFVILFDGATIALRGEGQERPAVCNACFVPAGLALTGGIATPGYLAHHDIHLAEVLARRTARPSVSLTMGMNN